MVPSRPQTGQFTATGIRPFTGCTSKAYFWPQWQTIFMGTVPLMRSPEK
jgi:hypothetical protein